MSGTSLDGLDLALVEFTTNYNWKFDVLKANTIKYPDELESKLRNAHNYTPEDYFRLDFEYGRFIGEKISEFIAASKIRPLLVASHGHTVLHQPEHGYTGQIGNGAAIATYSGITTVCDFRSKDITLGGQGAPLVPIGDKILFNEYIACLNLGGFSNISFDKSGVRIAFDICPVNFILNSLAQQLDQPFDKDGEIARRGKLDNTLYNKLNCLEYYFSPGPKSLGREWLEQHFYPLVLSSNSKVEDKIHTITQHIAFQINKILNNIPEGKILITGGGAYNKYLIELLTDYNQNIILPDKIIIDFKEAIIFAFLGLLRYKEINNTLSSVTGAKNDSIGGAIYL